MPGFYPEDEYDLAGFAVGIVDRDDIIDGERVRAGDAVIGLASSGVHSNGYSLVRKVFGLDEENGPRRASGDRKTLGELLLVPTRIYVKPVLGLMEKVRIKAVSHITGGVLRKYPRMLPGGMRP
jgi:phosphoribosylformylglycinamidine cyclo-ligase